MSVVLALRVRDAIVVAADSRLSFTTDGVTRAVHDRTCKILAYGGTVFAAAGYVQHEVDGHKIDAFQVAKSLMAVRTPVDELADAFTERIAPTLSESLGCALDTLRPWGNTDVAKGMQFMFVNAVGRQPSLAWRNLAATGRIASGRERIATVQARDWPGDDHLTLLVAGQHQEIQRHGRNHLGFRTIAQAHDTALRLIRLEAAANPDTVGGPHDVVVVGPKGVRWLQRKPELTYGWHSGAETAALAEG